MSVVTYTCTIAAPTFDDLIVPISSFSMRLRQAPADCYLSVIIPSILDYADDIADRSDGTIAIAQNIDGTPTTLLTANISDIRIDRGPRQRSGTITGYKEITHPGAGNHALSNPYYRQSTNGRRRYRCRPDAAVKPTDDVTINSETFEVSEIAWNVSQNQSTMEISEAET